MIRLKRIYFSLYLRYKLWRNKDKLKKIKEHKGFNYDG